MKTKTKYTFLCCVCGEEKEGFIEDDMEDGVEVYICGGEVKALLDGMEIFMDDFEVEEDGSIFMTYESQVCDDCFLGEGGEIRKEDGNLYSKCRICDVVFVKYWVRNVLWQKVFDTKCKLDGGHDKGGVVCKECFEKLLGRELQAEESQPSNLLRGGF